MSGQLSLIATSARPPITHFPREFADMDCKAMRRVCEPKRYQVTMWGKTFDRPRDEAWYHTDPTRGYVFGGGAPMMPEPWPDLLLAMKERVEDQTGQRYNSCFVNYYRDNQDGIDWHADDEDWIDKSILYTLSHGDLFVMHAGCQSSWQHCIPKRLKPCGPRINFTFRQ